MPFAIVPLSGSVKQFRARETRNADAGRTVRAVMKWFLPTVCLALWVAFAPATPAQAQEAAPSDGPEYTQPLGIALEEWPYPFPVKFLPLTVSGQSVRMAYMDVPPTGNANGKTVVVMHGKNFPGAYWENVAKTLAGAGYRIVIPDQLGFLTKSSKPDIAYTFDLLAANTIQLLDALNVKKAIFIGHSTCGMLAVRLARSYPERTEALVLEDPIGLEDYRQYYSPPTLETLTTDELKTTAAQFRQVVRKYFVTWKPEYERFVEPRMRLALSAEYPRWAKASASLYLMILQQPVRYEYRLIATPTLLIVGADDKTAILPQYAAPDQRAKMGRIADLARQAAVELPNGRLIIIPHCGHIPHIEQPAAFTDALLTFLKTTNKP